MPEAIDNKCRFCRREGFKLNLKGKRCTEAKCPIERRGAVAPGTRASQNSRRSRISEHARQLREKQKLRRFYGVEEKQFQIYFEKAKKKRGETADSLFKILESRLDNVVYRLGFAATREMARQMVSHGHVKVNEKKVDVPSYLVREDDTISLGTKGLKIPVVAQLMAEPSKLPEWLEKKAAVGRVKRLPAREEVNDIDVSDQAVVEYYSKK